MKENNVSGYLWPLVVVILIICITTIFCSAIYAGIAKQKIYVDKDLIQTTAIRCYGTVDKLQFVEYKVYIKSSDLIEFQKETYRLQQSFIGSKTVDILD